jgi:hypothetical protein
VIKDKNYKNYLFLKEKLNFIYKGVYYNKILSHDIGRTVFNNSLPHLFKEICINLFFSLDISPIIKSLENNSKILIYSVDRSDYKFQVDKTIEELTSTEVILLAKLKKKFAFNPLKAITSFLLVYRLLKKHENIINILFLSSKLVFYKSIHNQLHSAFKKKPQQKISVILFNSAYNIENLICQFFSLNDCSTFSLSHSFFVPYKKFTPIDIINGENIVSDKILVWGSSSIKDLEDNFNVPKEKIIVAGNPKYLQKKIDIKQSFSKCLVLLGRMIYHESNLQIIEIIKQIIDEDPNIRFDLKLHLSLDTEFYKEICHGTNITILEGTKSLIESFKDGYYDFSLVNNSTAYYEAMYYDMICFRYQVSENEFFNGLEDKFIDAYTLKQKILYFKTYNTNKLNAEVTALLRSTLGMGINNYKEILE